jgi:hypothetical protein
MGTEWFPPSPTPVEWTADHEGLRQMANGTNKEHEHHYCEEKKNNFPSRRTVLKTMTVILPKLLIGYSRVWRRIRTRDNVLLHVTFLNVTARKNKQNVKGPSRRGTYKHRPKKTKISVTGGDGDRYDTRARGSNAQQCQDGSNAWTTSDLFSDLLTFSVIVRLKPPSWNRSQTFD